MKVKVLKAFNDRGRMVHPGDSVTVDAPRHLALARNGLVEPPKGGEPAKPKPSATPGIVKNEPRPPSRKKITVTDA